MNKAATQRRYEISQCLTKSFIDERNKLCWEDYLKFVWDMAEDLCKKAIEDGLLWTKSKDCKLFNMTLTSAYDSFSYKQF